MSKKVYGYKAKDREDLIAKIKSVLGTCSDDAMTVNAIAGATGLPHDRTGERVRHLLRLMIGEPHYVPIVSSHRGYWIAGSVEDVEDALSSLEDRQGGIQERMDSLREAWLIRSDKIPRS